MTGRRDSGAATAPKASRRFRLPRQLGRTGESLAPIVAALVLVEIAFRLLDIHSTFFPRPSELLGRAVELVGPETNYLLLRNIRASLTHIGIGFAIAIVVGVSLGLTMGLFRPASFMLHPVVSFAMPLPMLAWAPIFLIVIGRGATTVTAITALAAFFPIVYNTVAGVKAVNRHHRWSLMAMGASRLQVVRQVVFPGSLSYVITGTRLGLGFAWRALISSEMVAGTNGLGYMIISSKRYLEMGNMYIAILSIGIIGLLLEEVVFASIEDWTVRRWGLLQTGS